MKNKWIALIILAMFGICGICVAAGPYTTPGASVWGTIVGTLSNQVDLQNALNGKIDSGSAVLLQPTTPGTAQTGNLNISGTGIFGALSGPLTGAVTGTASGNLANTLGTGKGTLVGFSAASTPGTLATGTNGYMLQADSTQPLGVGWVAVPVASGISTNKLNGLGVYADLLWADIPLANVPTAQNPPLDADGIVFGGSGASWAWRSCTFTQLKAYLFNSPTLVTPALGTPASGTITACTGTPLISPRVGTIADASTIYPSTDGTNTGTKVHHFTVTACAQTTTFALPPGAWVDGEKLVIRIYSAAARTINFTTNSTVWQGIVALPITTAAGKYTYVGCIYNSQANSNSGMFDVVATQTQP